MGRTSPLPTIPCCACQRQFLFKDPRLVRYPNYGHCVHGQALGRLLCSPLIDLSIRNVATVSTHHSWDGNTFLTFHTVITTFPTALSGAGNADPRLPCNGQSRVPAKSLTVNDLSSFNCHFICITAWYQRFVWFLK